MQPRVDKIRAIYRGLRRFGQEEGSLSIDDDDNLAQHTFREKPRGISFKAAVLGLLFAILLVEVSYTVYRWRMMPSVPSLVAVEISATPDGAAILIDGKQAGTSAVRQELPAGTHELRILSDGYEPKTQSFTLTEPQSIRVELQPLPMDLRIRSGEPKAEIWLDEQPQQVSADETIVRGVAAGMHTVRIKAPSAEANASFDFRPGSPPVPTFGEARPSIFFVGSVPGKVRAECNCTAQLDINGVTHSLAP